MVQRLAPALLTRTGGVRTANLVTKGRPALTLELLSHSTASTYGILSQEHFFPFTSHHRIREAHPLLVTEWIHFPVCESIWTYSGPNGVKSVNANVAQQFLLDNLAHLHEWSASAARGRAGTSPTVVFEDVPLYLRAPGLHWSSRSDINVKALVENWLHGVMVLNWCFLYHPSGGRKLSWTCLLISAGLLFSSLL